MHALFDQDMTASPARLGAGNWTYVKSQLADNLRRVMTYFQTSPMAVNSDHFLIRLLQSLTVPKTLSTERYYSNIDGLFSLNLSMALKMTSSLNRGRLFEGVFYGPGTQEILIAHTEPFDAEDATQNWREVRAIRVLRHPRSDLGLQLPNGRANGYETGFAVIAINVPLLAMQYRAFWLEQQYYAERFNDSPMSINQFVHMYALPSMLPSHLDYVLFNRLHNLVTYTPMGASKGRHPFALNSIEKTLNQVQLTLIDQLSKIKRGFSNLLYNVPAVTDETMREVMRLPEMATTQQVEWALDLARFPAVDFFLVMRERSDYTHQYPERNRIVQKLRYYESSNLYRNHLPRAAYEAVQFELNQLEDRLHAAW